MDVCADQGIVQALVFDCAVYFALLDLFPLWVVRNRWCSLEDAELNSMARFPGNIRGGTNWLSNAVSVSRGSISEQGQYRDVCADHRQYE
jgi:hypothetical protein